MGQSTSNFVRKCVRPFTGWSGSRDGAGNEMVPAGAVTPFVFKRQGSMFFDEEGDLAHEFYEEQTVRNKKGTVTVMRKCSHNLTPQGEVDLPHPRLNVDLPIAICEAPIR